MGSRQNAIKQIFIPYYEWEDYINGMWNNGNDNQLKDAVIFTSNYIEYGNAMAEVIKAWPKTMLNSLTNLSINRKAFLGHCAVSYKLNIPESITRQAWGLLTNEQRFKANEIAQKHINNYDYEYKKSIIKLHKGLGKQMLFKWNSR